MKNSNISFTPLTESSIKTIEVIIEGEANINLEQDVFQQFQTILFEYDYFIIRLRNIEVIDLPFIQLLISIQKTVKSKNKKISISIELPENLLTIVENSGFNIKNLFEQ